jgi:rod shape-determining protein MreD
MLKGMFWGSTIFSKIVFGAVILFILIVFQSLFSDVVTIMGVEFDLAIVLLVYIGLTRGPEYGVTFGFLIGLLLDVFNPQTLGCGALIKCLIGFAVGSFKDNLYLESLYSKAGLIFLVLIFNDLLHELVTTGLNASIFRTLTNDSLPSALYTSIVAMLIIFAAGKIRWERLETEKGSGQLE